MIIGKLENGRLIKSTLDSHLLVLEWRKRFHSDRERYDDILRLVQRRLIAYAM